MMRIAIATIWHGKDGYSLHVHDAKLLPWLEEEVTQLACSVSRGYLCPLCLCNKWDWTFRIGWGRDGDGLHTHSLGGLLFHLGQRTWLSSAEQIYTCDLPFDEVCEHFPGARVEWDDDGVRYVRGVLVQEDQP